MLSTASLTLEAHCLRIHHRPRSEPPHFKSQFNFRQRLNQIKIKVYSAVVLPTFFYACETWTVYSRHARLLNHFHTTSMGKILGIKMAG